MDHYLLLQYCRRQCNLFPSTWAKSLTKFNSKLQDFKHVLDLNCKRRIEQFNFFIWLSNVKNLVLSNDSKHVRIGTNDIKNFASFPPKLQSLSDWGEPDPHSLRRLFDFILALYLVHRLYPWKFVVSRIEHLLFLVFTSKYAKHKLHKTCVWLNPRKFVVSRTKHFFFLVFT